jgi:hypothetical protein
MVGIVVVFITITLELFAPNVLTEGFATALIPVTEKNYFGTFIPRRGDVGPEMEEGAYITDKRYFHDYADVQRIGVKHDWCRMVVPKGVAAATAAAAEEEAFFACALAGTENMNSLTFRTSSAPEKGSGRGTYWSRDDYMRDTTGSGRADYCRILKVDSETFEVQCNIAGDFAFGDVLQTDVAPPPDIAKLLTFYDGILWWLRLRDDMVDYAKNLEIRAAGGLTVDESEPNPAVAKTLVLNGLDQFLRIGDTKSLAFGEQILLRSMRSFCFWVYFDEFTNNACIFDFANGAARDNVKVGILGRGNPSIGDGDAIRPLLCDSGSTIPDTPSGAQRVIETTPQRLMETSSANVDEFVCPLPSVEPREFPPQRPPIKAVVAAKKADLYYEIWDSQQRKMRIIVKGAIPLQKWVHVVITADNNDAFRPDISVWVNGVKVFTQPSGWLPQNSSTAYNYVGKSNNYNLTTQFENGRDELFKGRLFDFRGYKSLMSETRIADTYAWGKELLAL